jgi:hypothetical protein
MSQAVHVCAWPDEPVKRLLPVSVWNAPWSWECLEQERNLYAGHMETHRAKDEPN